MPTDGWVVDLGANTGLFSIWAALTCAQVIAVEAQRGFAAEIRDLASHNGVAELVHVEIAMASGATSSGAAVGVVADDRRWAATSHGAPMRTDDISVPQLMSAFQIDRIGLLKVDIEGGEFAVFQPPKTCVGSDTLISWRWRSIATSATRPPCLNASGVVASTSTCAITMAHLSPVVPSTSTMPTAVGRERAISQN